MSAAHRLRELNLRRFIFSKRDGQWRTYLEGDQKAGPFAFGATKVEAMHRYSEDKKRRDLAKAPLDPDVVCSLSSLVATLEEVLDGNAEIVSYGPIPNEFGDFITVHHKIGGVEQFRAFGLIEFLEWLKARSRVEPDYPSPANSLP